MEEGMKMYVRSNQDFHLRVLHVSRCAEEESVNG